MLELGEECLGLGLADEHIERGPLLAPPVEQSRTAGIDQPGALTDSVR